MITPEEHLSADGLFKLAVELLEDGDAVIGFKIGDSRAFAGHTHPGILARLSSQSKEDAVRSYLEDILNDRRVIALLWEDDTLIDVWVSEDPAGDQSYPQGNERLELRYWSGAKFN